MEARLLAVMVKSHDLWESLACDYQVFDLDSYIARARIVAPDIFFENPQTEEIEGDIQDENDKNIITWEDGMDETVRIYEKI